MLRERVDILCILYGRFALIALKELQSFLFSFEFGVDACKNCIILVLRVMSVGTLYEFVCLLPFLRCLTVNVF